MALEVRDLDGDEPAREREVHVPGLVSLRRVDGGEDELELGRQPHEVPGPDELMELRLDEGIGPVEFIEEGGFGLPDGEGGGDELEGPFGQAFRIEESHQVVEIEGRDFVVAKLNSPAPKTAWAIVFDPSVLLVPMSPISKTGRSATMAASTNGSTTSHP